MHDLQVVGYLQTLGHENQGNWSSLNEECSSPTLLCRCLWCWLPWQLIHHWYHCLWTLRLCCPSVEPAAVGKESTCPAVAIVTWWGSWQQLSVAWTHPEPVMFWVLALWQPETMHQAKLHTLNTYCTATSKSSRIFTHLLKVIRANKRIDLLTMRPYRPSVRWVCKQPLKWLNQMPRNIFTKPLTSPLL